MSSRVSVSISGVCSVSVSVALSAPASVYPGLCWHAEEQPEPARKKPKASSWVLPTKKSDNQREKLQTGGVKAGAAPVKVFPPILAVHRFLFPPRGSPLGCQICRIHTFQLESNIPPHHIVFRIWLNGQKHHTGPRSLGTLFVPCLPTF